MSKSSTKRVGKPTKSTSAQPLCFVIGPIGKDGSDLRKHSDLLLHAVIKHVLEADEFGYQVKRADEDTDPGMIGDRAVADILRAELVVADLTDLNPNAFYELGIRHATEKPTVHIAKFGTPLPFDNIHHRTIFVDLSDWQSIEMGRTRLSESARAIKNPNFKVSNPITQANASFKMRTSADPQDVILAEIKERLATIEAQASESASPGITGRSRSVDQYVLVDTRDIFGEKGETVKIKYNKATAVGDLLDEIFYILKNKDKRIKEFRYNDQWYIEKENGRRIGTDGNAEERLLSTAGIYPSSILRVKPARPDWWRS
jgi:hypothetical protein